ncbi:Protein arginine N-methyltransferase 2 [Coccomyxa sp. Obi]|nr:Protein arginine N-methyltransferase 2 [Coccomyxa sp. Obi]
MVEASSTAEHSLAKPAEEEASEALYAEALIAAAAKGDVSGVGNLLERGADHLYQDDKGQNALLVASKGGHDSVVEILLEAGTPWNAIDKEGYCAGDLAMLAGHQSTVDILLEAGVRAEMVLGALERKLGRDSSERSHGYLQQRLQYDAASERLMDPDDKAVMMAWEGPLMEAHAHAVAASGGDVLNVGFGLGLVDEAIQRRSPRSHIIVEAHPDVHARMLQLGWDQRPGVRILFGRWQDVLPSLDAQFDGIFFDTFSEFYGDMQEFHALLPSLLRPGGIYSFFHGLAADNAFFHAVYTTIVERELARLGLSTQFVPLPINVSDPRIWEGVRNKYWQLDTYLLPVCTLAEDSKDDSAGN